MRVQVRDLLSEDRGAQLDIQNTKGSGTNVPEAIQIDVSSSQDVLDVMSQARPLQIPLFVVP